MITEILCLATAIFFEARAEPIDGQVMVAETIMNRVEDKRYPDNVCDVVFERRAFSFTHDGESDDMFEYDSYYDSKAQDVAIEIAKEVYYRKEPLTTATHYHAVGVKPMWRKHYVKEGRVGNHVFYTNETRWK